MDDNHDHKQFNNEEQLSAAVRDAPKKSDRLLHDWSLGSGSHEGQALVIMAFGFILLLAIGALTIDVGILWLQHRNLQNIADSAALAGAQEYNASNPSNIIVSTNGVASAQAFVDRQGIPCPATSTGTGCTVGILTADPSAIQVTVRRTIPLAFAPVLSFFAPGNFRESTVQATAVARAKRPRSSGATIISFTDVNVSLLSGGPNPVTLFFEGDIIAQSGNIGTNSNNFTLDLSTGNGLLAAAGAIDARLAVNGQTSQGDSTLVTRYPNPYAGLSLPTPTGTCSGTTKQVNIGGIANTWTDIVPGSLIFPTNSTIIASRDTSTGDSGQVKLYPGEYCGIQIQDTACVQFQPGVYRVLGDVTFTNTLGSGSPSQNCLRSPNTEVFGGSTPDEGVILSVEGTININGRTHVQLRGHPSYRDLAFVGWGSSISMTNLTNSKIQGSVYAPNGQVEILGNSPPASDGMRITKGENATRGGRIVARSVLLNVNSSLGSQLRVSEYLETSIEFAPIATLIR